MMIPVMDFMYVKVESGKIQYKDALDWTASGSVLVNNNNKRR